jgi:hypothetical protein
MGGIFMFIPLFVLYGESLMKYTYMYRVVENDTPLELFCGVEEPGVIRPTFAYAHILAIFLKTSSS